jgi:leader peptidase (prepilin peptidase)/N-methyltransferase
MIIPNKVLLAFLPVVLGIRLFHHEQPLVYYLIASALGCGLFVLIAFITRGKLGMGDAKLFGVLGLFAGLPHLFTALFVGSILALVFAGTLLALGKIKRKSPLPFGPFLAAGTIIVYVFGEELLVWHQALISNLLQ